MTPTVTPTEHGPDIDEPTPTATPAERQTDLDRPTGTQRPAWPSGVAPGDPRPVPIMWRNLPRWAQLTWRTERRYYLRLGRPARVTPRRIARSVFPSLARPVFLIGAARSGTTFLGDCLGRLPEITYHFEPPATKAAGRYAHDRIWSERRTRWFYRLVYRWLIRVELDGGLRFSEKTPTNALLIPFLSRAFPDAQFIHVIRDGRDASASLLRKPWLLAASRDSGIREPGGYPQGPYAQWWVEPERRDEFEQTSDVHRAIWAWRRYLEAAMRDGPSLGTERYLEIRYEEVAREPARIGEQVLDFLDIRDPASRRIFMEAIGTVESTGVGAWRAEFTDDDLAVIEADSGDLLRSLGYTA